MLYSNKSVNYFLSLDVFFYFLFVFQKEYISGVCTFLFFPSPPAEGNSELSFVGASR